MLRVPRPRSRAWVLSLAVPLLASPQAPHLQKGLTAKPMGVVQKGVSGSKGKGDPHTPLCFQLKIGLNPSRIKADIRMSNICRAPTRCPALCQVLDHSWQLVWGGHISQSSDTIFWHSHMLGTARGCQPLTWRNPPSGPRARLAPSGRGRRVCCWGEGRLDFKPGDVRGERRGEGEPGTCVGKGRKET